MPPCCHIVTPNLINITTVLYDIALFTLQLLRLAVPLTCCKYKTVIVGVQKTIANEIILHYMTPLQTSEPLNDTTIGNTKQKIN